MSQTIVKALYNYDSTTERGHGIHVLAGEKFRLISDENEHWWYVSKNLPAENGFYLPKSYLKVLSVEEENDCKPPVDHHHHSSLWSLNDDFHEGNDSDISEYCSSVPFGCLSESRRVSASIPVSLDRLSLIPDSKIRSSAVELDDIVGGSYFTCKHGTSNAAISTNAAVHTQSRSLDDDWMPRSAVACFSHVEKPIETSCHSPEVNCLLANPLPLSSLQQLFLFQLLHNGRDVRSRSPIYANVQDSCDPVPLLSPGMEPLRTLANGWQEYVSTAGRPFFYHPASGASSWKPPRGLQATEEHPVEHCTLAESYHKAAPENMGLMSVSSGAEYCSVPVVRLSGNGMSSSKDALSAFNEERSEHCVRVSVRDFSELNRLLSSSQLQPQRSRSSFTASLYNPCMSASDGALKLNTFARPPRKVIKCGNLARCKFMDGGKRIRKHWFTCFVYLTNAHMIFYKDQKASEKQGNQYAAPLGVCDLRGAKIKWLDDDKSKRKRLFQLELVDGTAYLFHSESDAEIIDWFDALKEILADMPHPGFSRTPVIERGSYKPALRRSPAGSQKLPIKETKSANDFKENRPADLAGPSINSVEASVPSKQSILDKLVRFLRNRPSIEFLKEKGIYKPEPVFGSSLIEICRREKSTVPKFVAVCTSLIEERGLETDGLYRMSGNLSQIQKIRCSIDQEKYSLLINESDIHVITGTLKLFFRELQEPLFPMFLVKDFMSAIKLQNAKLRFKAFKELVARMPVPHHNTLNVLLIHLLRVAQNSAKNRMQVHNLAIVFGPTLFCSSPKPDKPEVVCHGRKRLCKKVGLAKAHVGPAVAPYPDVVQTNSHLAFSMIMHGQIVEYMLKEHSRLFRVSSGYTP
ncbi:hypothetical protein M513_01434 [Trichuris suis]|uniref:RhoGAP domain protein n=1 Tax=Trichuris suis TaxID=68888 RepID=A0A085MKL8_9BILA|nr:hypothetical protein M513_01434 [Trichuris suis]